MSGRSIQVISIDGAVLFRDIEIVGETVYLPREIKTEFKSAFELNGFLWVSKDEPEDFRKGEAVIAIGVVINGKSYGPKEFKELLCN